MKARFVVLLLAVALSALWLAGSGGPEPVAAATAAAASASAPSACTFPTSASDPAEAAWRIFVAANCPSPANPKQLVWETWIEQLALYPASGVAGPRQGKPKRLHGSPLGFILNAKKAGAAVPFPPSDCSTIQAKFRPANVKQNAKVCEEVHINPSAQQFIASQSNEYQVRTGQKTAAQKGTNIQFPTDGIEVKVDWLPAKDFLQPFTCSHPPPGVYVETIEGECYAMAGMHISSKLLPDWLWATFEPQSMKTNPNRCKTYGPCDDPWGSNPPTSNGGPPPGGFTQQTDPLKALMADAHLAPAFSNYRMDGAQIIVGTAAQPTQLGNSIIEGENAGVPVGKASCVMCHSESSIKTDGEDGLNNITPSTGPLYTPPAGWILRDFVWSLSEACPDGPGKVGSGQTCKSSTGAKTKKPKSK